MERRSCRGWTWAGRARPSWWCRSQAAKDAADGLASLPVLQTWGSQAAEAAHAAIGRTRADLDAHGNEALAGSNAARGAADNIERIKAELASLQADAAALGMAIDEVAGTVVPGPTVRNPMEAELKVMQLQPRLDKIVAEANLVDLALASDQHGRRRDPAAADGSASGDPRPAAAAGPHAVRRLLAPPVAAAEELPLQPRPQHRQPSRYAAGDDDYPGADYYNRLHLPEQVKKAEAAQAHADALAAQNPDWAAGQNIPEPNKPGGHLRRPAEIRSVATGIRHRTERRKVPAGFAGGRQSRLRAPGTQTHAARYRHRPAGQGCDRRGRP